MKGVASSPPSLRGIEPQKKKKRSKTSGLRPGGGLSTPLIEGIWVVRGVELGSELGQRGLEIGSV